MRYKHAKFSVILNLCLIAGALLFVRCALAMNGYFNTLDMSKDADISAIKPMQAPQVQSSRVYFLFARSFTRCMQLLTSTEWLRGDRLCTWKGACSPPPLHAACQRVQRRKPSPRMVRAHVGPLLQHNGCWHPQVLSRRPSAFYEITHSRHPSHTCNQLPSHTCHQLRHVCPVCRLYRQVQQRSSAHGTSSNVPLRARPGHGRNGHPKSSRASVYLVLVLHGTGAKALVVIVCTLAADPPLLFPALQIFVMFFVIYSSFNKDKVAAAGSPKSPVKGKGKQHSN